MIKLLVDVFATKYEIELDDMPESETKELCFSVKMVIDDIDVYTGVLTREPQVPAEI